MPGVVEERHLAQILHLTLKLEHLCLKVPWGTENQDTLVQALRDSLPTLRTLKMVWGIKNNRTAEQFPRLIRALQALAHHPNNINEFNLIFKIPLSRTLATQDWEKIDQVLADRAEEKKTQDQVTEFRVKKLLRLSLASDDYLDFQFTLDDEPC